MRFSLITNGFLGNPFNDIFATKIHFKINCFADKQSDLRKRGLIIQMIEQLIQIFSLLSDILSRNNCIRLT